MAGLDAYLWLKWLHNLSSTVLFGTGLGTALQMWFAHRRGDAATIAVVAGNVVLADWLFILPAGLVQPSTGLALALKAGLLLSTSWMVATYALYAIAFLCWGPAVVLQFRVRDLARQAAAARSGPAQGIPGHDAPVVRAGWPAFLALVVIFLLMVAKPRLW